MIDHVWENEKAFHYVHACPLKQIKDDTNLKLSMFLNVSFEGYVFYVSS